MPDRDANRRAPVIASNAEYHFVGSMHDPVATVLASYAGTASSSEGTIAENPHGASQWRLLGSIMVDAIMCGAINMPALIPKAG